MIYQPGDDRWFPTVTGFERSLKRLEQQPIYIVDVRSGALDAWIAGGSAVDADDINSDWNRMVADKATQGATVTRIRVAHDSRYQQWLREASVPNIAAGETIHYLELDKATETGVTDAGDWWIVDDETLIEFGFPDGPLELPTVRTTKDPGTVAAALESWDFAVAVVEGSSVAV